MFTAQTLKSTLLGGAAALLAGAALAKIPAPVLDDAAKAKAAEAAARTAWAGKVDNFKLCKSMEQVAGHYFKTTGKNTKPPAETPACVDPGPFAYNPNPAGAAPAAAAPAAAAPAKVAPAAPAAGKKS